MIKTIDNGWIALPRNVSAHWSWTSEPFTKGQAFADLYFLATYEDAYSNYRGERIFCKRGDVNLSIQAIAKRWGWSEKKARHFINQLEEEGLVKTHITKHRTIITVLDYDIIKQKGVQHTTHTTHKQVLDSSIQNGVKKDGRNLDKNTGKYPGHFDCN